jgi:RHS repeat-associated protein
VTGTWAFGYDTLNRLTAANASSGPYSGESGCWNYDAFGNRTVEAFSTQTTTPCAQGANDNAQYTVTTPTALNQVSGFQYDAAGNVLNDGKNNYWYDAEGRLCAVAYPNGSGGAYYEQYLYDAEGRRVGKVPASSLSCAAPTGAPTNQYLLGLGGEQVTEVNGLGAPLHTNAYAGGKLLATYDFINGGLHFVLTDPLGTKRVQISATGTAELNCQSLPFGNDLGNPRVTDCVVPTNGVGAPDATEHHFTGKERDAESGNDFFTARYYASSFGRFASPDDGSDQNPSDPQSWNLYSYVRNNALSNTDLDGHGCQKTIFSHLDANGNRVVDDTVWDLSDCFFGFVDTTINVTKSTANAFSQAISQTTQHAPNNGTPVHGPWTYGNHCGPGGMGPDINGTDAACHQHDDCYDRGGFTMWSNFQGPNAQLQACNQQLCNAVRATRTSLAIPWLPSLAPTSALQEAGADRDINTYFTWVMAPGGNSCH